MSISQPAVHYSASKIGVDVNGEMRRVCRVGLAGLDRKGAIAEGRQAREPDVSGAVGRQPTGNLDREPCLAQARGPGDGQQPRAASQANELEQLALTPHEGGRLRRQPCRRPGSLAHEHRSHRQANQSN